MVTPICRRAEDAIRSLCMHLASQSPGTMAAMKGIANVPSRGLTAGAQNRGILAPCPEFLDVRMQSLQDCKIFFFNEMCSSSQKFKRKPSRSDKPE